MIISALVSITYLDTIIIFVFFSWLIESSGGISSTLICDIIFASWLSLFNALSKFFCALVVYLSLFSFSCFSSSGIVSGGYCSSSKTNFFLSISNSSPFGSLILGLLPIELFCELCLGYLVTLVKIFSFSTSSYISSMAVLMSGLFWIWEIFWLIYFWFRRVPASVNSFISIIWFILESYFRFTSSSFLSSDIFVSSMLLLCW